MKMMMTMKQHSARAASKETTRTKITNKIGGANNNIYIRIISIIYGVYNSIKRRRKK